MDLSALESQLEMTMKTLTEAKEKEVNKYDRLEDSLSPAVSSGYGTSTASSSSDQIFDKPRKNHASNYFDTTIDDKDIYGNFFYISNMDKCEIATK